MDDFTTFLRVLNRPKYRLHQRDADVSTYAFQARDRLNGDVLWKCPHEEGHLTWGAAVKCVESLWQGDPAEASGLKRKKRRDM